MVVELVSSALLVPDHGALAIVGLVLAATTWVATFALAVPRHARLEHGWDADTARGLVTTGWVRTLAWTAHAGVALALLA